MDYSTIGVGRETRERLAEYRDNEGFANYNKAINALLDEVTDDE